MAAVAVSTRTPAMRSRMSQRVVHSVGSIINMVSGNTVYGRRPMDDSDQQLASVLQGQGFVAFAVGHGARKKARGRSWAVVSLWSSLGGLVWRTEDGLLILTTFFLIPVLYFVYTTYSSSAMIAVNQKDIT